VAGVRESRRRGQFDFRPPATKLTEIGAGGAT
jgi:hypothetical protein